MTDTEPLLDQLIDVGNKALADHYHEDLCHCSTWPDACASGLKAFTWDTNAFAIALPAILAAYEKKRTADHPPHTYLSTGFHHGQHDYCQATEGQAGPKDPGKCKWCPSKCVCPCHQTPG